MKDFQERLKYHMDRGATYLEALHLLKTMENEQSPVHRHAKKEQREYERK